MTIEELLNSYFQRDAKVSEQLDTIERAEADMQPVPKLTISVPNYADEVIRPILKMVAVALPEYEITVPSSKQCKLVNGLFQIRTDKICLGGLSYPTKDDHKLYFAPLFHRKAGERQEVKTLERVSKNYYYIIRDNGKLYNAVIDIWKTGVEKLGVKSKKYDDIKKAAKYTYTY